MIRLLSERIAERGLPLREWFEHHQRSLAHPEPPIYASIDLRNAGFKVSVVDTNLFPAGFNNLCETFSAKASEAFSVFLRQWHPSVKKIQIVPEEHTRNVYYLKNIEALRRILSQAGVEVSVRSLSESVMESENFQPDLILLNNDLSTGVPSYLKDRKELILPNPALGWYQRRKSDHFRHYLRLTTEAGEILDIDPWFLSPLTTVEDGIDLADEGSLKRLKESTDQLILQIRKKYLQHGIQREPYLFVKSDSGTYGMGIVHVTSGEQILQMGRKARNKLASSKGGRTISEYLLQEGIPTADRYRGKSLEPVVYLVGGEMAGTFFRIHDEKNDMENLNQPGMRFACLCLHKLDGKEHHCELSYENSDQLLSVGSFLGRIASLAASYELEEWLTPLAPRVKSFLK